MVDDVARLRTGTFLGDRTNGWAVFVGRHVINGVEAEYSWAVAADDAPDALKIIAREQPVPKEGFRILARLSQLTIARLGLRIGEACPL